MDSARFSLNREDAVKILKVAGFSVASTLLTCGMVLIAHANVPITWLWLVPVVNTVLVALKKFVDGQPTT